MAKSGFTRPIWSTLYGTLVVLTNFLEVNGPDSEDENSIPEKQKKRASLPPMPLRVTRNFIRPSSAALPPK